MSSITNIVAPEELTPQEEIVVKAALSDPVVRKYLRILGVNDASELLTLNILDMAPESIANRHHFVSGKLAVYSTLLSL
jgi:hypothetical protein